MADVKAQPDTPVVTRAEVPVKQGERMNTTVSTKPIRLEAETAAKMDLSELQELRAILQQTLQNTFQAYETKEEKLHRLLTENQQELKMYLSLKQKDRTVTLRQKKLQIINQCKLLRKALLRTRDEVSTTLHDLRVVDQQIKVKSSLKELTLTGKRDRVDPTEEPTTAVKKMKTEE